MRHFPSTRQPVRIEGLTHERAPFTLPRRTALLAAVVIFVAGLFLGGLAFGSALVRDTDAQLRAQSLSQINHQK